MRRYAVEDEVRLTLARDIHDWARAGLLSPEQAQGLGADLATDLRRTGVMLRLGLAIFTFIAGAAAVGFVMLLTDLRSELAVSATLAGLAVAAMTAASALVRRYRLYRYGVEEALAMGAVVLAGVSVALLSSEGFAAGADGVAWAAGMATVALVGLETYRRLGLQYAAVVALYAAALVPGGFGSIGVEVKRVVAAVVCAAAYGYATRVHRRADDDVRRSDAVVLRAAAAVGAYLALNLLVPGEPLGGAVAGWYHWSSWAMTWLLPFAFGRAAVLARDPWLLRVAIATGLTTLATNKAYLGWARHPWDPMVLGVLLVAVALGLRRWLSAGTGGERHGFTARQILDREDATIQLASLASAALQPSPPARPAPEPEDPFFSGGRSGGAGAGSTF